MQLLSRPFFGAAGLRTAETARASTATASPRLLLVSELYPPDVGGSAVLLHEGYSRLGGDMTVVTDAATHIEGRTAAGARIVPAPIAMTRWGLINRRAATQHLGLARRLRRLASSRDVVHCARALPEGVAAWLSHLAGGAPYVCWSHGEDVTGALSSRELTFLMTRVYRGASAVIANSRNTRSLLRELGVPSSRIHVVYPGVDPGRFTPAVDGTAIRQSLAPRSETVLLSVGRLQRRKGHDLAIRAVAALKREQRTIRYVIVGTGDERAYLQTLAADLGVTDRVWFAGEVSPEDLPRYYAACDVFLLPNRIEQRDIEGFGIVFLEAAAAGRAVIGGRTGGVPEAVADGLTGVLVSGTDVDELACVVRRLVCDRALAQRLGRAGRERVLKAFTWDQTAERIRAVHEGVLGRAPRRADEQGVD
ncbi:MAG TPA: glycosyltransferase family 4 protein [Vicinamibacterales bacterium]|nr:glycosyltransferase family 4 protein [Vicinamibacterales bacterium]